MPYFQNKSTLSGGLASYILTKFQGVIIDDACLQSPHIEALFIKVLKTIKFIIGMVYRLPTQHSLIFLSLWKKFYKYYRI